MSNPYAPPPEKPTDQPSGNDGVQPNGQATRPQPPEQHERPKPTRTKNVPGSAPAPKRTGMQNPLNLNPQQIEKLRPLAKLVSSFTVSLGLSFVFFSFTPLPWSIAGVFTFAWAIYQGVRAFRRSKKTENGHLFSTTLTVALVFSLFVAFTALSSILTWPAQWEWHNCNASALTVAAQEQCSTQFSQRSQGIIGRLFPSTGGTGTGTGN